MPVGLFEPAPVQCQWESRPHAADSAPASGRQPRASSKPLGRERHVVSVLTRHGFGLLVQHSRLPIVRRAGLLGRPQSLRNALEELGTTFVKLGQILSTRPDLLPEEYVDALSTLQDSLAPIDHDAICGVIERELGAPPEKLFAYFDPAPLATASIGQVHAAALADGTSLVVKVQKPGIVAEIELDLQIIHDLSSLAATRIDLPLIWNFEEIVDQFSDGLREEVDYLHEARNAERFARLVSEDANLAIPAVHWDFTTSRVLTLGRIDGLKISDLAGLERMGVDRRESLAPYRARCCSRFSIMATSTPIPIRATTWFEATASSVSLTSA